MSRRVEGRLWIVAVNERDDEVEATIQLPNGTRSLKRWFADDDAPEIRDGDLIDSFGPYGVHVFCGP